MNIQKRLKHIEGYGVYFERQVFGANIQILRKKKFLKKSFLQVCCDYHSVFGLSFDAYIRACACVKSKKQGCFSRYICYKIPNDAV